LKTGPGNHDCNGFLKNFASAAEIVTIADGVRFCPLFQKLGVELRNGSLATPAKSQATTSNHGLSEFQLGVFLNLFATPTVFLTSAV
jgi:hypothetical protein